MPNHALSWPVTDAVWSGIQRNTFTGKRLIGFWSFSSSRQISDGVYDKSVSSTNNLQGGYLIKCPFKWVGWGLVCTVMCVPNVPRHGAAKATGNLVRYPQKRLTSWWYGSWTQSGATAKIAGRNITWMVQLRELMRDGYCWESFVGG